MGVTLDSALNPHKPEGFGEVVAPDPDYFKALQAEVNDKGFLVTSAEELFQWAAPARCGG
jgi:NADH-quinone oxidoreductase subunit B